MLFKYPLLSRYTSHIMEEGGIEHIWSDRLQGILIFIIKMKIDKVKSFREKFRKLNSYLIVWRNFMVSHIVDALASLVIFPYRSLNSIVSYSNYKCWHFHFTNEYLSWGSIFITVPPNIQPMSQAFIGWKRLRRNISRNYQVYTSHISSWRKLRLWSLAPPS